MWCESCKYYCQKESRDQTRAYEEICLRDGERTKAWYSSCMKHATDERMLTVNRINVGVRPAP